MSDFNLTFRQTEDLGNKVGGQAGALGILSGERVVVSRSEAISRGNILTFNQNIAVTGGEFVTDQCFIKANPKVKFWYIDERLPKLFGKASKQVPAGQLATHTILVLAHDPDIMGAIKPHARRFTHIGQFYRLIEAQGYGQEGSLFVNGYANIAYVVDNNDAVWTFSARWRAEDGWIVRLYSVADAHEWNAGFQVLSQVA